STSMDLQAVLDAPGVRGKTVTEIPKDGLTGFIQSIISNKSRESQEEPFYVLDLGVVMALLEKWAHSLPMAQPFYAVKCNSNPALLGALATLGASFDCASRVEIESILSLGVSSDRIIYANPCKAESHIRYAARVGVNLTTFDSKHEIEKIRKWNPNCTLLLRIKPPNEDGAKFQLGAKYGALEEEVEPLLKAAHNACLKVAGVSFHIGSAATRSGPYRLAIEAAKTAFEIAAQLGMPKMHILNIGGGFMAGNFDEAASTIKEALLTYFPEKEEGDLTVIAEPGRYFAESASALATSIIGKRIRGNLREYWIGDGIHGSMNRIVQHYGSIMCSPLAVESNRKNITCKGEKTYNSTVFGPTCDADDTIFRSYLLPELEVNDWLVFPNMGAYTAVAGSNFNGFKTAAIPTNLAYSGSYSKP
ncbi:ornithine decarboxylase-like, partial [Tripterygium wilfordii]|uniref:ornithine decarboxylase-like n=1 Tax=Tripterygium wilfordii TaxID=458696 RepID=UPI0018F81C46